MYKEHISYHHKLTVSSFLTENLSHGVQYLILILVL